jgi:hypothetical protein
MLATEWTVNVHGMRGADIIFKNESLATDVAQQLADHHIDCERVGTTIAAKSYWKDVFQALIEIEPT